MVFRYFSKLFLGEVIPVFFLQVSCVVFLVFRCIIFISWENAHQSYGKTGSLENGGAESERCWQKLKE